MSTTRNYWNQATSWAIALVSMWIAVFTVVPFELVEDSSERDVLEAASQQAVDLAGEFDDGPSVVAAVPAMQVPFVGMVEADFTPATTDDLHAAPVDILAYAPKQSPPSLM